MALPAPNFPQICSLSRDLNPFAVPDKVTQNIPGFSAGFPCRGSKSQQTAAGDSLAFPWQYPNLFPFLTPLIHWFRVGKAHFSCFNSACHSLLQGSPLKHGKPGKIIPAQGPRHIQGGILGVKAPKNMGISSFEASRLRKGTEPLIFLQREQLKSRGMAWKSFQIPWKNLLPNNLQRGSWHGKWSWLNGKDRKRGEGAFPGCAVGTRQGSRGLFPELNP